MGDLPQLPKHIITVDNRHLLDQVKVAPIKKLLQQHRRRWVLDSSYGPFILKRLTYVDLEDVTSINMENKRYMELIKEASDIQDHAAYKTGLDAEQIVRLAELGEELSPFVSKFSIHCFENPEIDSVEALDSLFEMLPKSERTELYNILRELSNPDPGGKVSETALIVCKEFGIPLPDDLNIESMTAQQGTVLIEAAATNAERLKELINGP